MDIGRSSRRGQVPIGSPEILDQVRPPKLLGSCRSRRRSKSDMLEFQWYSKGGSQVCYPHNEGKVHVGGGL